MSKSWCKVSMNELGGGLVWSGISRKTGIENKQR